MPTIEIEVNSEGASQVRTHGFSGNGCRLASRFLEQALGEVTHEELTPEFHQAGTTVTNLQSEQL